MSDPDHVECEVADAHVHRTTAPQLVMFHGDIVVLDHAPLVLVPMFHPGMAGVAQRIADLLNEHGLGAVPDGLFPPPFAPPVGPARLSPWPAPSVGAVPPEVQP